MAKSLSSATHSNTLGVRKTLAMSLNLSSFDKRRPMFLVITCEVCSLSRPNLNRSKSSSGLQNLSIPHIYSLCYDMKIAVVSRSGSELIKGGLELQASATVSDLQQGIYSRTKKFYPARQRLTLPSKSKEISVVLNPKKKLSDYADGKTDDITVVFKDLGPQVSYRTLFFWEYFGPLVIYPIFYFLPVYKIFVYEEKQPITHPVQTYALYYWCFHYMKRILETFLVHRFSHDTSPISNVYRNCAYYWTFAACIAYSVNHPHYAPVRDLQWKIGLSFGLICQISNLYCHIILKNLRSSDGVGGYQIPQGFLFNFVTCANYTTEIYQWLGFNIATQTVPGYLFLLVGTRFMYNWAVGKHTRMNKIFDGKDGRPKYPRRWVFLPPFY